MFTNLTVCFLNDTSGGYHWGCYGTSEYIKEEIRKRNPKELISHSVEETHQIQNAPQSVSDFETSVDLFCSSNSKIIDSVQKSDIIIINGEGTIHRLWGATKLLYLIWINNQILHKKQFLVNHSCFPMTKNKDVLDYYRVCYKCIDYVAVREKDSFNIVKNTLGIQNCILAFDSLPLKINSTQVHKYTSTQVHKYTSTQVHKIIVLSGGVNFNIRRCAIIAKCLNWFYKGYKFVFLTGSVRSVCDDGDINIYNEMKKCLPDIELVDAKTFEEWLSVISHCEVLLSGRFHYTVAAMALGTKSISFESNTPKTNAIRKMFGLSSAIEYTPMRYIPRKSFMLKLIGHLIKIRFERKKKILDKMCQLAENNYKYKNTLQMLKIGGGVINTWAKEHIYTETMENRVKKMVSVINLEIGINNISSIMDLGCGLQTLKKYIPKEIGYYPVNQYNQVEGTIIKDFNKNEFLNVPVDLVFASGILEYIYDMEWFLDRISTNCKYFICSYYKPRQQEEPILVHNVDESVKRVNHYTIEELMSIMQKYTAFSLLKQTITNDGEHQLFLFKNNNKCD